MRTWFSRLTLNQKLAALALALGMVAVAARPYGGDRVAIDSRALASIVAGGGDRVDVADLADWILAGRGDFRLIDLRDEAAYATYHIPNAQRVPVTALEDAPLLRTDRIVLYADDGVRAAQAWVLLKVRGYRKVYFLDGGLEAWLNRVVFPALVENPTPADRERDDRRRAVSAYFGGSPRSGAALADAVSAASLPRMEMPPVGAAPTAAKKKKKEGC